ncbi:MAG: RNA polymerase sigma factor RpoH [Rhodospirillales bacterium]|nr:RNA polymerase sigma factor RpoH [Rhodospirillales bacterium]MCW8862192.1 RNA polymerase sigma factor RpoH [Rhodospirillales bacterium]MCW8952053.1 RNA polymerase sigma factor RpoH [Rhodospirillales bacterium]MCW8970551.1 RNA polymerase sigma factor RpoH [Rhodospirillales bacterium]MCW9002545.1 RNA polymerase sigma factor RpoH [Rhodospirillales bacterium]
MTVGNLPVLSAEEGLTRYLQSIRKYPILAPEQEFMLAKRLQEHGDVDAAHALVTSHLRLVAKIAFGYRGYGLPVADLISEGNVGLMKAVKKFDPDRGFRLATYAMWWIKASVTEYILQSWSLVKLGTVAAQKKLFFSLRRIKKELGVVEGNELTHAQVEDLSKRIGISESELVNMDRRLLARDMSLNAPMPSDDGSEYIDLLADDRPDPESIVSARQEESNNLSLLSDALATLPDRERHILSERRLTDKPKKLEELGVHYGISRERVRQLEVRAFEKVKAFVLETSGRQLPALSSS